MRNIIMILILGIATSCVSNRYLLTDKNQDRKYLIDYIQDLEKQDKITMEPLIVIDGFAHNEKLKGNSIPLKKEDIFKVDYLSKDSDAATMIYGERGEKGVLLVSTKKSQERLQEKSAKSSSDSKILILIGEQQITQEELQQLDPEDIESITVIKEKESVMKYTLEDYDGVVVITMKKDVKKN